MKRDAWKQLNDWSHNINDDELNDLFDEYEDEDILIESEPTALVSFFRFVFGFLIVFGLFSVALWQLVSTVLGVSDFTFFKAFIATVCVAVIRYTDAGIIKQMKL